MNRLNFFKRYFILYFVILLFLANNKNLPQQVPFTVDPNIVQLKKNKNIKTFLEDTILIYEEGNFNYKPKLKVYPVINIRNGNTDLLIKNYLIKSFPKLRINYVNLDSIYNKYNNLENYKFGGDEFDAKYNKDKYGTQLVDKIRNTNFSVIFLKNLEEEYNFDSGGFSIQFNLTVWTGSTNSTNYIPKNIKSDENIFFKMNEKLAEKFKKSKEVYMFCNFQINHEDTEKEPGDYEPTDREYNNLNYDVNNLYCGLYEKKIDKVIFSDNYSDDIEPNSVIGNGKDKDGYLYSFNGDKVPYPIIDFDLRNYYPREAKLANISERTVTLLVQIDENGTVVSSRIVSGKAGYGFDEAALRIISRIRFKPGLVKGKPTKMVHRVPITFSLDEGESEPKKE